MTEAQFVIERRCLKADPPPEPAGDERLPVCVWVDLSETDGLECGGKTYQILTERRATTLGGAKLPVFGRHGGAACVCEHMGHLIE